jgi:uncharacterized protein involved in outer membrane biogenesis
MAETTSPAPTPKRRRLWLRILVSLIGVLLLLIIVGFFVATSSGFFKSFILPRAGKAMNATITVSDASIHPFSEVLLKDFKVQTTGSEPLVSASEVRARYSLMDIIRGNIKVAEVTLASPTVTLVENPDGSSNLDPITKGEPSKPTETKPSTPSKSSKPPQVDVNKIALTGATIRKVKIYAGGNRDLMELSDVNVTLDNIKNGQAGKMEVSANVKMDNHPPAPAEGGAADGKLSGKFDFAFSPDLKPSNVKGNLHFAVNNAQGSLKDLASFGTDLDADVSATDIKQIALRFTRGSDQLGQVRLAGPFDMEKNEGKLVLQILGIDKRLLNLAQSGSGCDFGTTTISSTNEIQLTKSGKAITASGHLDIHQLQVTRANQTSPQMDLRLQYATDIDLASSNAIVRELLFTGTEKGNAVLRTDLSKPMSFAWGAASTVPDSTLDVSITGFNLADWKPFLGDNISSGTINAKLNVLSQQGGQLLGLKGDMKVSNLIVKNPKAEASPSPLEAGLQVDASYGKQIADIRQCVFSLTPTSKAKNQLQLTGHVDMSKTNAITGTIKLTADALDLTSYYDMFANTNGASTGSSTPTPAPTTTTQPAAAAGPQKELEPIKLPLRNFTAEAILNRIYLHEVEITNMQVTAKLDSGSAKITPFKLFLNGAPVTASVDADVSIPGYKYNFVLSAQKVPIAPLVNSFQPERKGQVSGTLIAEANISGLGTTGENLQKNLKGNFNFNSTNLNLSIHNIKNKILRDICEVIVSIPSISANPSSALANLGKGLLGQKSSGSSEDLSKSIINAVVARGTSGSGRIDLQQTTVESPLFKADVTGTVTLAPILTNSTLNLPVSVSLERATASRLGLVPEGTSTNATYAKLPDFFVEKGTVGTPKKDVNPKPLLGLALQTAGKAIGGSTGSQLQNLAGSLTGKSGTNSSGTNTSGNSGQSLLQSAENLLNRNRNTGTNATSTNQSSGGLLDQFLKPKK